MCICLVGRLSPLLHHPQLVLTNLCLCVCVCVVVCRCVCQVVWAVGAESSSKEPDKAPRRLLKEVCLNTAAGHSGGWARKALINAFAATVTVSLPPPYCTI
jgi:hypothetical protein